VALTIKDGIVYDAYKLLADVRAIVAKAKADAGRPVLYQPGSPGDVPNLQKEKNPADPADPADRSKSVLPHAH
jgi:hypothetical protein